MELEREDILYYIEAIKAVYPRAYDDKTGEQKKLFVTLWLQCLRQYPKEVVDRAVLESIRKSKFPPVIADVIEQIERITKSGQKTSMEAWHELSYAARQADELSRDLCFDFIDPRTGLSQGEMARRKIKEVWSELSEPVQAYVGSVDNLLRIGEQNDMSYEKGRFLREYNNICETAKLRQTLPLSLTQGILKRIE